MSFVRLPSASSDSFEFRGSHTFTVSGSDTISSPFTDDAAVPPPIAPTTSYRLADAEDLQPAGPFCTACSAGEDPSKQATCRLLRNGEDQRVWIQAHNAENCCGHLHRTLVLCFDGTGDQFDESNSSIVNFVSMLRKDKNPRQLVYYQAGLGTYTNFKAPLAGAISMTLDQMIAWNLESHVTEGYKFLMEHYTHGDKICIFGFSRGAYTARALAGMLQKVGLLPVCNHEQVPFAYKMYKTDTQQGYRESNHFKMTFCRPVTVHFLGVWDTVASVGLVPRYLPFTSENTGIRFLRHAIALDEHRVKFLPQFCVDGPPQPAEPEAPFARTTGQDATDGTTNGTNGTNGASNGVKNRKAHRQNTGTHQFEALENRRDVSDVKEVWFSGVHCDVGGGAVDNKDKTYLARIPLRWMIRECFNANTGIVFDARMLQKVGLPVYRDKLTKEPTLGPLYTWNPNAPRLYPDTYKPEKPLSMWWAFVNAVTVPFRIFGSWFRSDPEPSYETWDDGVNSLLAETPDEYEADMADIATPEHDQIQKKAMWILMEMIPMYLKSNKAIRQGEKAGYSWYWNWFRGRKIPRSELLEGWKVHRSVKMRLEWDPNYIPRAEPNVETGKVKVTKHGETKKERKTRQLTREEWDTAEPIHFTWVS